MTTEYLVVMALFATWATAVTIKGVLTLKKGEKYKFGLWDGGMIRSGRVLTPRSTKIKVAMSALLAAVVGLVLTNVIGYSPGMEILIAVVVLAMINDFAGGERS